MQTPPTTRAPLIRNAGTFDLPARPRLLAALADAAEQDDITMEQIADLVEGDPGLAGAVVKSSNSAFHSGVRDIAITSVRQAVQTLGLRSLIALATGAFLRRSFPSSTPQIEELWARSTQLANVCARIAQDSGRVPRDVAYTFGLFRFIGCAVLVLQAPGYKSTFASLGRPEFAQNERSNHGITHAQVGAGLVVRWGMGREMVEAVGSSADLGLLEHLHISGEAKAILAVGALAQLELMPASVDGADALRAACVRVLG